MMKKLAALMLTIAALCITAAPVAAGERAGAFSISPFVGGYTFDGVQGLETAPVYGLRLGIDLTKSFGVELVGDYLATETSRGNKTSMNAISYRLDFLFNLADGPFVPYIAVGGGGMTLGHGDKFDLSSNPLTPNTFGLKNNPFGGRNTFATVNAGLGFKYFMTDSVAFRLDVRELGVFPEAHNSLVYNTEYTAGLTFLFGGEKPAPPPPPPPAPTSSLLVTPGSINKGETATLNWSSQNTTNCDITPGIGPVNTQGSMIIKPEANTAYTLSCNGPGGRSSSSANITIAAPPPVPTSSLTITPTAITQGESATINWTSQNATNCDIQPAIGPVQPQGTMKVSPAADTAYTLTCTGPGGTTTSAANLSVAAPPPPEMLCYKINIEFDTGKSNIKPQYHDELVKLADFMKQYPNLTGVIEGHTDSVGSEEYNLKLSDRRANSVRDYLVTKLGIDGSRLTAKGFGESRPEADNKTAEGRQRNRRVVANFACVEKKVEKKK